MPTLAFREMEVKPLPQTVQHEFWCEHCTYGMRFQAFPAGTLADMRASERAAEMKRQHARARPGHRARTRMHCRNIDTGSEIVLLRTGEGEAS